MSTDTKKRHLSALVERVTSQAVDGRGLQHLGSFRLSSIIVGSRSAHRGGYTSKLSAIMEVTQNFNKLYISIQTLHLHPQEALQRRGILH